VEGNRKESEMKLKRREIGKKQKGM